MDYTAKKSEANWPDQRPSTAGSTPDVKHPIERFHDLHVKLCGVVERVEADVSRIVGTASTPNEATNTVQHQESVVDALITIANQMNTQINRLNSAIQNLNARI